jgi:hypothetical protein
VTLPQKIQRARSTCIRPFKAADAADEAVEEALAVEQAARDAELAGLDEARQLAQQAAAITGAGERATSGTDHVLPVYFRFV